MKTVAKKTRPSALTRLVTGASWVSFALLSLCSLSIFVNPAEYPYAGIVGLAFPIFLLGCVATLVLSLAFAPRMCWISLLALVLNFFTIRSYIPFNLPEKVPDDCIKVLSYNTWCFGGGGKKDAAGNNLLALWVVEQNPDIYCYQEGTTGTSYDNECAPLLRHYAYADTAEIHPTTTIGYFGRFPVVGKETLYRSSTNGSAVFKLLVAPRDTLYLVNNHLKSVGLSEEEREQYAGIVHGDETESANDVKRQSRTILSKLARASAKRAEQVMAVAAFLERHREDNVVVCGDFNDTPVSYAHHRLSEGLIDCYEATGNGIGRSFSKHAMYVRIDNIFCSTHWKPYKCYIDQSVRLSDHYPIVAFLKRNSE